MTGVLHRRTVTGLWLWSCLLLLPDPIECIYGSVRTRDKITRQQHAYELRKSNQYQGCVDDLFSSDLNDNSRIDEEEYVVFISKRSAGAVVVDEYSNLPFPLISSFVYGSCFCSFVLKIPNCCVGGAAGIDIDPNRSEFIDDNLITICRTVDDYLGTSFTHSPTLPPTSAPTIEPTTIQPTPILSEVPTASPTSRPTSEDLLCVYFQYALKNDEGLSSDDIENGINNNVKEGLIIATQEVTMQALNDTIPADLEGQRALLFHDTTSIRSKTLDPLQYFVTITDGEFIVEEDYTLAKNEYGQSSNGRWKDEGHQRRIPAVSPPGESSTENDRLLAFYDYSYPPVITDVVDNPYCPEYDEGITCSIVFTKVCVVLEEGDDEDEVKDELLDGIQLSFQDGTFENAIPSYDELFGEKLEV